MKIVTDAYRNSALAYGRKAAIDLLERWWWAFALPLAAAAVASFWDWRWIVAALALALLCYPFALMMAYYSRALTPEAAKALLLKRVEVGSDGIDIVYFPYDEESAAPVPDHIRLEEIRLCESGADAFKIHHAKGCLAIPFSALDRQREADLAAFFANLHR